MPERRNDRRRPKKQDTAVVGLLVGRTWAALTQRPVDSVAILVAAGTTAMIVVNALFLQAGARPAPFVVTPMPQMVTGEVRAKPSEPAVTRSADTNLTRAAAPLQAPQPVPLPLPAPQRRNDPIAELIGPSPRVLAVQRVLSAYGYGQIKPSGVLDDATCAAIEKFEREHKMPVSGQVSERLVKELAAMTGHPIE